MAETHDLELEHLQSNHEGELVDAVHGARGRCAAIVINAGALTHYGRSLQDALAAFDGPDRRAPPLEPGRPGGVAPHLGDRPVATAIIAGLGGHGYPHGHRRGREVARMRRCPPMDVAGAGRAALRARARRRAGCDALLVTHLTNIRYLTGFTGSAALLLVRPDALTFVTDGRYEEQAAGQLARRGRRRRHRDRSHRRRAARARSASCAAGIARLGSGGRARDAGRSSGATPTSGSRRPSSCPSSGLVEALRLVKDDGRGRPHRGRVRHRRCGAGGGGPAARGRPHRARRSPSSSTPRCAGRAPTTCRFETIVAAGPNGSRPHHSPSDRRIERGDLVVIDFGALVDGYHSDMTRTIAVGGPEALDDTQTRMVEVVRASQAAGVAAVRAGASTRDVDAACRDVIAEAGWGDAFVHGTGHGVGLDIHEDPRVSWSADATLAAGHVVTVEPGVYLPGHGGVRIEDTVVVTESGCRTLTRAPKS